MRRYPVLLLAVLALPHALSCSGSGVSADELCGRLTRSMCEGNVSCCDVASRTSESVEACMSANLDLCDNIIGDNARSGALRYDAAEAELLAQLIDASARTCQPLPELGLAYYLRADRHAPRVGLARVLEPTLPDGAPCAVDATPGNACINSCVRDADAGLSGRGMCAYVPPLSEGDACTPGGAAWSPVSCGDGLACASCQLQSAACVQEQAGLLLHGYCAPRHRLGQRCSRGTCGGPSYCDALPGFPDPGYCVNTKEDGHPCISHQECTVGFCDHTDDPDVESRCGAEPPARSHCPVWRGRIG